MPVELNASNAEVLTFADRDALAAQLRTAWGNLPPEAQAALKPTLDEAHVQLGKFLQDGTPPEHDTQQVLRMKSYLTNDWDGHLQRLHQPANRAVAQPLAAPVSWPAIEISVGPGGGILGTGKYQQLDLRWELVAGTVWLEHLLHKHPFPGGTPKIVPMADDVTITLASDFGSGNFGAGDSPSTRIAKFIPSLKPDYTIHLGDVYYAGTSGEEASNLLGLWPRGSKGSFALNSNHEMYSGGTPYFNQAVGGPVFNKLQSPWSFFALENEHWIVVGLDSAYYAEVLTLYLHGTLGKSDNTQTAFLREIAGRGKKVIVLTHHNGIPIDGVPGAKPPQLYTDVMDAFAGHPAPAYWYFGHEHIAAAYAPLENGTLCRCLGHSALPWGLASDLVKAKAAGRVQWFERCNASDPEDDLRVYNGFVSLQLRGAELVETYYDETGRVAWTPGRVDTRCGQ